MKAKYITPSAETIVFKCLSPIAASADHCDEFCKYWHFCKDRIIGKICYDKRY